jgi:hypothetical protein
MEEWTSFPRTHDPEGRSEFLRKEHLQLRKVARAQPPLQRQRSEPTGHLEARLFSLFTVTCPLEKTCIREKTECESHFPAR